MEILGLIIMIISYIIIGIFISDLNNTTTIILVLCLIALVIGVTMTTYSTTKEEIAIECLKGNNPYKMKIKYELKDSIYIPSDTIYVEIEK